MSTTIKDTRHSTAQTKQQEEPLRLKTHEEVEEYLARHLRPVRFGPKGQPIYALKDMEALNVIFPDDI